MEREDRGRRSLAFRLATLLGLGTAVLLLLAGCGGEGVGDFTPYTTVSPRTEDAGIIHSIYQLLFWAALVVFVGVQIAIVYTALRFRRRGIPEERPEQVHGSRRLEIAWTIIPAIVLLVILIPTIAAMYEFDEAAAEGDMTIDVIGKQWWWEVFYPELGVLTANEIRVPQGQEILVNLYSNNVIHSFWVPQLNGKLDVIPGRVNTLSFHAEEVGEYYGECAEFCGAAHAWMRFKVIVMPPDEFEAWVAAWQAGPTEESAEVAGTGDVAQPPASFGVCLACHRIEGTNANFAPTGMEAPYVMGPNLTLYGCRDSIAAGMLENTPENLAAWLRDPGAIKEDVLMPDYNLTEEQIDELVAYLLSLRPEDGCPTDAAEYPPALDAEV